MSVYHLKNETPLKKKILNTSEKSPKGYIVEVDLEFPEHLHEQFKEFPPCPESLTPNIKWFSDYQKEIGETNGRVKGNKYNGSNKVSPASIQARKI